MNSHLKYAYDLAQTASPIAREHDCVRVLRSVLTIDGVTIAAKTLGTIVSWNGSAAMVEFAEPSGALAILEAEDLEPAV